MKNIKNNIKNIAFYIILIIVLAFVLFPLYWMFLTSFKTRIQTFEYPPLFIFQPTLEAWESILNPSAAMGSAVIGEITSWGYVAYPYVINSAIIGLGNVLFSLALGMPAAYALSRLKVKGKENIAFWFLSMRFAPGIAIAIPLYLSFRLIGLFNTYLGVILAHSSFNIPFVIWIMRSFIDELSRDIEDSAKVDGCTLFGAFIRIVLPLTKPAIAVASTFSFIFSWNEFLFALMLTGDQTATFPVYISRFYSGMAINWGAFMASATLGIIPIIVFTAIMQKYIVAGLTMGAMKGG
jgi:multiple sugar transport system permease protein